MGVLGLGREAHFSEFNDPLADATGNLTPLARKNLALANLGLTIPTASGGALRGQMPAVATATDTATLTTAQVLNGVIHGTPTAAAAYTMPAIATMVAALPADFAIGEYIEFSVVNLAATATFDITMTGGGGTGVTVVGPPRIGAGSASPNIGDEWQAGIFRLRRTGAATFDLIRVG